MNCQKGDLAVYVRSKAGNEGKIVRCIRLATIEELEAWHHRSDDGPVWIVDRLIPRSRFPAPLSKDRNLRPIRDPGDDATDETLLWLPSPSREKESA